MLKALASGAGSSPVVTIRRHLTWARPTAAVEVLMTVGADVPFLLDRPFGNGHVLMFAIPADRSWSNFPLSPHFLPILHQAVHFAAGLADAKPYGQLTRHLALAAYVPDAEPHVALRGPDDAPVPVRSATRDGKVTRYAENLLLPGVYRWSVSGSDAWRPAVALNADREESDLSPVEREAIVSSLGVPDVRIAEGKDALLCLVEDHRVGRTLGEALLWLAFVVAMVELLYANRKARAASPVAALPLEPSGRIAGRRTA
jgi:hypothetical protein